MSYMSTKLNNVITIDELVTIHYFEYTSDFSFPGELHDFWEFVYVDKGEVRIYMDDTPMILKKGEIAFHKPNEFHKVDALGTCAPNLIVVSFHCTNPAMIHFERQVLKIDEMEHTLLADMLVEAKRTFSSRLDDPYLTQLHKKDAIFWGAEQMLKLHLEHFLIHLLRRQCILEDKTAIPSVSPHKISKTTTDDEIFHKILIYMEEHLYSQISIKQICEDNTISRSHLQKIFQKHASLGIIEYFSKMKIEAAKQMIRTGQMNFTQISERLGYTSIHYFSRQFKKITEMTPSEYASSVKAITERSVL